MVPVDVVVDGNVVAVVIVVRLLCLNLTVTSSNHNVTFMQKYLTCPVLHTHENIVDTGLLDDHGWFRSNKKLVPPDHGGRT